MTENLLVRNAKIYDGSGGEPFRGDFTVIGGKFSMVRNFSSAASRVTEVGGSFHGFRVIDAEGLCAAPGFLDVHAHSDLTLPAAPEGISKVSQGVTTEISGNCGHSMFPVTDANYGQIATECKRYGLSCDWRSYADYRAFLAGRNPALRAFHFCGHNTLVSAYPGDIEGQVRSLREAIGQGALGLSTGLLYAPGRDEPFRNLAALMRVLRETDLLYVTHLRSEGNRLEEALEEAIALARLGSGRLHISHLKTAGEGNWQKLPSVLKIIREAQMDGLRVTADRYPYTYSQTSFSVVLPGKYDSLRDAEIQERLSGNAEECRRLSVDAELNRRVRNVILTVSSKEAYKGILGKTIEESARTRGVSPGALAVEILREDAACAMAAFPGMSEENMQTILKLPFVCCGTDENATPTDQSCGRGHPRRFGSFPLFLRAVSEQAGMAEAIRRVSALPADIFHLRGLGHIAPGYHGDFVLFDEDALDSRADFVHPHRQPEGIYSVYRDGNCIFRGDRAN